MEISKEKQIEEMEKVMCGYYGTEKCYDCRYCCDCHIKHEADRLYNAGYRKIPDNIGDFSDGYHTFNELYHHRAVLFSVICNTFPEKAWKSKFHDTGDMYEGMFIVGIETEHGQAAYHYDIEPYWDMFKVKELEKAPKWDGHTPSDAIERIGNLSCAVYRKQSEGEWISVEERLPEIETPVLVFTAKGRYYVGYYYEAVVDDKFTGFYADACRRDVTHWMPLPEPPKAKQPKAKQPKAKQPKDSENYEKKRLLAGDCFHGEIWCRCPYCFTGIEVHSIPKDRICHNCGKEYL